MADLVTALEGLTPAVPPINVSKPWKGEPFDPDKFLDAGHRGDPNMSITAFDPLRDRSA
jgi:hypothetical protein